MYAATSANKKYEAHDVLTAPKRAMEMLFAKNWAVEFTIMRKKMRPRPVGGI